MLAVTTAVYGRVSDLVGIRLPLIFGVGLMTAGALVAAFAPNFGTLLVARMFQGAGAAAIPTLGVALLSSRYDGEVRGLALGRLAGMAAAVSCLGPFIGGAVENAFGWRAVMALPILGALVLPFLWHALAGGGSGARLDLVGAVLVAGTAGGLVLLVQSPTTGLAVAVVGLLLVLLGAPAVALRVRHRPCGFLPRLGGPQRHRRPQRGRGRGGPRRLVRAADRGARGAGRRRVGGLGGRPAARPERGVRAVRPPHRRAAAGPVGAARVAGRSPASSPPPPWCWPRSAPRTLLPALLTVAVILVTVAFGLGQPAMSAPPSATRSTSTFAVLRWASPRCCSWSAAASARPSSPGSAT